MFFIKALSLIIIFATSSCAFKNKESVFIAIDSDPVGAKIYIDGKYMGDTVKELSLVPSKDYNLRLVKDGYKTIDYTMKTSFTMRKRRYAEHRRCRTDLIGSVFLLPIIGLKSAHCRDFEKEIYYFDLEAAPQYSSFGGHYIPPQYIPPQSISDVQKVYSQPVQYQQPVYQQPVYQQPAYAAQNVTPQTFATPSAEYSNPYQNYYPPTAGAAYQQPMDYDNSYKAPTYVQGYQQDSMNSPSPSAYSMVGEDPNRPRPQQSGNYYGNNYNDNDSGYVAPYRATNASSEFANDGYAGRRPGSY